jgi:hypothetical protein
MALRFATEAGKKVTYQASNAFSEAEKMMLRYVRSVYR